MAKKQEEEEKTPVFSAKSSSDRTTTLEVACWANDVTYQDGNKGVLYSVSLSRSYKDQNGQWNNGSSSFRPHDLPVVQYLLNKAYAWVMDQKADIPF